MDPLDAFDGHLRRIAQAAVRLTPRLISIAPREDRDRTVVYVRMDTCSSAVFLQLIRQMEDFCRREGIPPDFRFSYEVSPPGRRPPMAGPEDLPQTWPPAPS